MEFGESKIHGELHGEKVDISDYLLEILVVFVFTPASQHIDTISIIIYHLAYYITIIILPKIQYDQESSSNQLMKQSIRSD